MDRGAKIWAIRLVVVILLPVFVSSCNPPPYFEKIHLYDGPNLPTENLAVLQIGEREWGPIQYFTYVRRGGREIYDGYNESYKGESHFLWGNMLLLPGEYGIGARISQVYPAVCENNFTANVDLQAGHLYVLNARRSSHWGDVNCHYYVWLEDEAAGEIVAGQSGP